MSYQVIIADDRYPHYQEETEVLQPIGAAIVNIKSQAPVDLLNACRQADGIIVNLASMTADIIRELAKCRIISRYGVGYDNVDVKAATARGIWVANVPDYCGEDVSDQALALLMSCVRKVALRDRQVRAGVWNIQSAGPQWRLKGKTFVLFGYGQIARILHRKLAGFQLGRVLVVDPFVDAEVIRAAGAEKADWDTALHEGDFFSIHMPLNDQTRGLFNEAIFRKMKCTAIVINTSRGGLIDERSLAKALAEGWINSAGLDVFEKEPINADNPLLTLDNITVSGHTGWYTEESQTELKRKAAENVRDVLTRGKPKYAVNKI
ncbi:MAG: C-terminal binding protein [Verrucomicrobia bacterium]|nr:C-terminal binding protein [Verrucomicrobiota bacterium]MCG2679223.1 C-terminal binding protein [Kiritimatiellia bacterium]MBU4248617.1 C-terminal binding protein [Verrucomicrobiota bacterium]MBU4290078.1 C-terminal binding protein [Verrucomicrobiota bacterium]MBU4430478.1 C-terminal binding protein [Verrucomicrobiota bacterium]